MSSHSASCQPSVNPQVQEIRVVPECRHEIRPRASKSLKLHVLLKGDEDDRRLRNVCFQIYLCRSWSGGANSAKDSHWTIEKVYSFYKRNSIRGTGSGYLRGLKHRLNDDCDTARWANNIYYFKPQKAKGGQRKKKSEEVENTMQVIKSQMILII